MRIMGIDYGAKRIGIAFSDEAGQYALPHAVIKNSKTALADIAELAKKNSVKEIVLGESHDYKGKPNPIQPAITAFKEGLEKEKLTVHLEPEFMTSMQARHIQGENDMNDASAAALILQGYLDKKNR